MNRICKTGGILFLLGVLSLGPVWSQSVTWKKVRVLVYTKNGKGYVHDNIPNAVACIRTLGQQHGFAVDVADQPDVFTETNLKQYTLLLFASTNNDVFDTDQQRLTFRRYIEAGGGFVGIHSVMGTERNWSWFKRMIGGTFAWHPRFQPFTVEVLDTRHPSMQGLPKRWQKEDEFYFTKEMLPGPTVIMASDMTTLKPDEPEKIKTFGGSYTQLYPSAWYYNFDGGYTWCTTLGHAKTDYLNDELFIKHIFQGIRYVAGQVNRIDFSKAYADDRDSPIR
ncbi:type 1 glutamine amidotransferase [Spirosoma lacussanchae]|uniref:ThuA domain-containing protein n=1 Tax=Spirosoma lacussanchae TaxID=1884249 RepID=UPI001108F7CF|nr:ThuA domain-containing protein [Spirosoma lacussanchae]